MSFYVKRERFVGQTGRQICWPQHIRIGWTGPIRSARQAERERAAWVNAGWAATVEQSTPEVRKQVRDWERDNKTA